MEAYAIPADAIRGFETYIGDLRKGKTQFPCAGCSIQVLALIVLPCCGKLCCFECLLPQ